MELSNSAYFPESWSRCMVCAGNESITTLFSLASLISSRFLLWYICPSKRSKCLFSGLDFIQLMKWCNHCKNTSVSIHPDSVHENTVPFGASIFKLSARRFRLKISIGGMKCPVGEWQYTPVVLVPRSALVAASTCRFPVVEITLDGVECPVSSMLYICLQWNHVLRWAGNIYQRTPQYLSSWTPSFFQWKSFLESEVTVQGAYS